MKYFMIAMLALLSGQIYGASSLPTVEYVDLNQYQGKWYSVASLPQFFNRGCLYQTAEYKVQSSQEVGVFNTCVKARKIKTIKGVATIDNLKTNADLTVHFRLFWGLFGVQGDYKVLALDDDYQYVMVGGEDRKSLWIMSRTKSIPQNIMDNYVALAKELGFQTGHLVHSKF